MWLPTCRMLPGCRPKDRRLLRLRASAWRRSCRRCFDSRTHEGLFFSANAEDGLRRRLVQRRERGKQANANCAPPSSHCPIALRAPRGAGDVVDGPITIRARGDELTSLDTFREACHDKLSSRAKTAIPSSREGQTATPVPGPISQFSRHSCLGTICRPGSTAGATKARTT